MEGYQPTAPIGNDIGREQDKVIPAAAIDRQIADQLLADGLRNLGLLRIEHRGLALTMTSEERSQRPGWR